MPLMCECDRPSVRPSNPYVCISCGGQRPISSPSAILSDNDDRYVEREIPRDSFGNYDPSDDYLNWLDDHS